MAGPIYTEEGVKDYYGMLGVAPGASFNTIKKAYHEKAKVLHPDKGGDKEDFQFLNEAYENLKDEHKRAVYDLTLDKAHTKEYPDFGVSASSSSSSSSAPRRNADIQFPSNPQVFGRYADFFVFVSPELVKKGFIKEVIKGEHSVHSTSFEVDFPQGYHIDLTKISYNQEERMFEIPIRKFKELTYATPTINYVLKAVALPLICSEAGKYELVDLPLGLLTVSAGHQFAVFSHVAGISNEYLKETICTHRSVQPSLLKGRGGFIDENRDAFIPGEKFKTPLTQQEIEAARNAITDLQGRLFPRKGQIQSIEDAIASDSRSELRQAMNQESNPLRKMGLYKDKKTPASGSSLEYNPAEEDGKEGKQAIDYKPPKT